MFGLKRDVPLLLILAVVVVIAAVAYASSRLFAGMTEAVEETQYKTIETIVSTALRDAENGAMARAQLIADLPSTRTIFATQDAASRDRLLGEYRQMFSVQHDKYGVDQMQFHSPPGTSFLRLQNPQAFGDDLTQFRPLVVAVNRDQIARKAAAVARTGPAIFGVVPVYDMNNRHVGSFEVGLDFGPVLDTLKADHGLELALLVAEEPLRRFVAPDVVAPLLNDQNRVGRFIKTTATHWDLLKQVVTAGDVVAVDAARHYASEADDRPYGVVLVPIRNLAGEPVGVIAAAKDFSLSRAAARQSLVLQGLIALFAIVILAGVVLVVVRGMLLDPLRELQALREQPAPAVERPAAEAA